MTNYPFLRLAGVNVDCSGRGMISGYVLDILRFHYTLNLRHYLSNNICGISGSLQLRQQDTEFRVSPDEKECSKSLTDLFAYVCDLSEKTTEAVKRPSKFFDLRYDPVERILAEGYRRFVEYHSFFEIAEQVNVELARIYGLNQKDSHLADAVRNSRIMLHNIRYLGTLIDFEFEEGSLAPSGNPVPHIKIPRLQV
ncbi:hypothetical protein J4413_03525 [Candidatus Woesearchaeota archaeon]|nr:hypothetical protein [Candidatus Woesearchaeota archaeon]